MSDVKKYELLDGLELDTAHKIQKHGPDVDATISYFTGQEEYPFDFSHHERQTNQVKIVHTLGSLAIDKDARIVIVGSFDDNKEGYITDTDIEIAGTIEVYPNLMSAETEYHLRYNQPFASQ